MNKHQKKEAARLRCVSQGQDPDEMIERPGLPPIPRWVAVQRDIKNERDEPVGPAIQPDEYKGATLAIRGTHDDQTVSQMRDCMSVGKVTAGVICADGHLGYAQPVGGVIAYDDQISISGVGFDIACGNKAIRLGTTFGQIKDRLDEIRDEIGRTISFGVGRTNDERVDAALFDNADLWRASGMASLKDKARAQLGTVGSGNHYVDIFVEAPQGVEIFNWNDQPVWIGVHFGSRGLGHKTATHYLKAAGGRDGMNVPPAVVDVASEIGERYLSGMNLAGQYAYAGRDWVCERVRRIIGGPVTKEVHNHHNFAWHEMHGGKGVWVVRKGATPAFPGQEGFVGGSMGDNAVIIEGVDSEEAKSLLYSTVHGAGRLYGRRKALRELSRDEMHQWLRDAGVRLIGGDLDESPMAYRRLGEVLHDQGDTIRVNHVLKPVIVAMAGNDVVDPYKD